MENNPEPEVIDVPPVETKTLPTGWGAKFRENRQRQLDRDYPLPAPATEEERPLPNMGFDLIVFFGCCLIIYITVSIISITWTEIQFHGAMSKVTTGVTIKDLVGLGTNDVSLKVEQVQALTRTFADTYKDSRTSVYDFHKTVISTVLFPILTGLLGYTFGQKQGQKQSEREKV